MRSKQTYDLFVDNEFSMQEWSAATVVSPKEIMACLDKFHLVGRVIKEMKFVGLCYNLRRDWIEETAYNGLENLDEDRRQEKSAYDSISPDTQYLRWAEIDEPFLIRFEDGDTLEIDMHLPCRYRFSLNCIPWEIDAGTNLPNADAGVLFAPAIGHGITNIEAKTIRGSTPAEEHLREHPYAASSQLVFHLDNGFGIRISDDGIDFCEAEMIDVENETSTIPFSELRQGLFNWEDIHVDAVVGYRSCSSTLFFGETGAEHTDEPYMTIIPKGIGTSVNISVDDIDLIAWAYLNTQRKYFDIYKHYDFSKEEWDAVLAEAKHILCFQTFDDLFDYMVSLDIRSKAGSSIPLARLNTNGARFWRRHRIYEGQYEALRKWTDLVLPSCEGFTMYGF